MSIRKEMLEDESNAERWMISYADFITLLFAFFVVMYAISSVNNEKYKVLSDSLAEVFPAEVSSPDLIQIGEPSLAASPHVVDIPDVDGWADPVDGDTQITSSDPVEDIQNAGFDSAEGVSIQVNNDWLELSLEGAYLFAGGSANLQASAQSKLSELATMLRAHDNPITIEGYTDNVPQSGQQFDSNWVLSAARASAVAKFFVDNGIRRNRISAVGYGENHPKETNATPAGRAQNRRVVIVVARRTDLARNRNAETSIAAVDRARRQPEALVAPQRTEDGGLLFTNESPTGE